MSRLEICALAVVTIACCSAGWDFAVNLAATSSVETWADIDLNDSVVAESEFQSGAAVKDSIPALTTPEVTVAEQATWLHGSSRVVGVVVDGVPRAYPLHLLERHEVVNDRIGKVAFAVTYCPLCDSTVVFDRQLGDEELEFGVSGLLFKSNVVMYDRRTGSTWSQLGAVCLSGVNVGKQLPVLPFEITRWRDWWARHPNTTIVSSTAGNGFGDAYSSYRQYHESQTPAFAVKPESNRFPAFTPMLCVWTDDHARAYPMQSFQHSPEDVELTEMIGTASVTVQFDALSRSLRLTDLSPDVQCASSYWFAWYAFHPDTTVYDAVQSSSKNLDH